MAAAAINTPGRPDIGFETLIRLNFQLLYLRYSSYNGVYNAICGLQVELYGYARGLTIQQV